MNTKNTIYTILLLKDHQKVINEYLKRNIFTATINDLFAHIFHQDIQYTNYFIMFVMHTYIYIYICICVCVCVIFLLNN